jgi:asparagine synthase (glutamine-hydrolysing)
MCGITGIFSKNLARSSRKEALINMVAALQHRGPDGSGVYLTEDIALGHARLAIIDLSGGNQPMISDPYVIVYNGEIYNYIELREELRQKENIHFKTSSDTEVVIKAFEVYGLDALAKFNGQFSFILWDKKEKKLIIARDRYGVRPLYILHHNNSYYFSSELKAFDPIEGYQRRYHIENLFEHALMWNTIADGTVYENIRSLPAGTCEIYQEGCQIKNIRYYEIGETSASPPADFQTALEEFTLLLNDSVKLRLRSDVPVATYLSGGIDSSVTTYLTSLHNKEIFKTFSVSFEDKDFDESSFQQEMVARLNSEHFNLQISYSMIAENFLEAVYHFERPVFRTAPVPLFLLSKMVHDEGIKVVLTGEGADEVLFGYDSFKEVKLLDFWAKQPESTMRPLLLKKLYPHLQHYKDPRQFGLIRLYYEEFLKDYNNELVGLNIRIYNNKAISNFFNKDLQVTFSKEKLLSKIRQILPRNFDNWTLLQKNQFLEFKTLLSGYLLSAQGDRMSMAHSVEGRYPFLDHRLVEKLFYYPDNFKLKVFSQKYILGKAFQNTIPATIIKRPKRPYMAPDLKSFFISGKLTEQAAYFLSDNMLDQYGIFDKKIVSMLIKKFERRMPEEIGYRDNMAFTFVLSCQMANYWARNPKNNSLNMNQLQIFEE